MKINNWNEEVILWFICVLLPISNLTKTGTEQESQKQEQKKELLMDVLYNAGDRRRNNVNRRKINENQQLDSRNYTLVYF